MLCSCASPRPLSAAVWVAIPPVVCGFMATYTLVIFFSMLHIVDALNASDDIRKLVDQRALCTLGSDKEEVEFDDLLEVCCERAGVVQKRLSYVCEQWSPLLFHLLFFSNLQIISILGNIDTHMMGAPRENGVVYPIHWYLQDIFHGLGGLAGLTMLFLCGGCVTHFMQKIVSDIDEHLEVSNASRRQRILMGAGLTNELPGFSIFYLSFNLDVTVNFIWALVCTLWASLTITFQNEEFMSDPTEEGDWFCKCMSSDKLQGFWMGAGAILDNGLLNASAFAIASDSVYQELAYPRSYGVGCGVHDAGLEPFCNNTFNEEPTTCLINWCYVEVAHCLGDGLPTFASSIWDGLHYSAETCGTRDDDGGASGGRGRG